MSLRTGRPAVGISYSQLAVPLVPGVGVGAGPLDPPGPRARGTALARAWVY
jgi:hypothetical protein